MDDRQLDLLRRLLDTPSPSGFEKSVQSIYFKEVSSFLPTPPEVDVYGNVIARFPGRSPKAILLAGHCDEIGVIVHYIDEHGFLYFSNIGGVDPHALVGHRVRLFGPGGEVPGVIGRLPIHLQPRDEEQTKKKIQLHDLWIDIGATSYEQAQRLAPVGTPGIWGEGFRLLFSGRASARDFDDKCGVFVVIETLRMLAAMPDKPPVSVIGVSTIQEECGVWGAGQVAEALDPLAAIAIDVTHATDSPATEKKRFGEIKLGGGPVIHRGVRSSKVLNAALIEAAERHSISYQVEAENGRFGTDADPISTRRGGIPVNTLSIPLRYMHTAVEVASLDDIEAAAAVLFSMIMALPHDTDLRPFSF